jgi:hypothetical protein
MQVGCLDPLLSGHNVDALCGAYSLEGFRTTLQ